MKILVPISFTGRFPSAVKDPDSIADFSRDWALWLDGDSIVTSQWFLPDAEEGDNLEIVSDSFTPTTTTVRLSGGVLGQMYTVTNRITTAGGRRQDASFKLRIQQM